MPLTSESLRTPQPEPVVVTPVEVQGDEVLIHGDSDDLIEITGRVAGCEEYNAQDAHFMLVGGNRQVRIRVWFTKNGVWAISASQAAEGMEILPVVIEGGAGTHSVQARVTGVRLITREF